MSSASDIVLEGRDGVAVVWFNRPERLNAFRGATFQLLQEALDRCASDAECGSVILIGKGRGFCAGEDLDEMHDTVLHGFGLRAARRELTRLQNLTRKLLDYPKPVIAAINGPAVGFGAELTLACDIRIGSSDAYFYYPEAFRAMLQTNGAFNLLPRIVGQGRAAEWLLTARRVPADEAYRAGLLTAVVDPAELLDGAHAVAKALMSARAAPNVRAG